MKGEKMANKLKEKPMKEILYRESRLAKALGDPAKYAIVDFLIKNESANVSSIARAIHRHIATTSYHLAQLRKLEIVRYEVHQDGVYYGLKYPKEIKAVTKVLSTFVMRTLQRIEDDV